MNYYYSDGNEKFGPMAAEEAAKKVIGNPEGRNFIWKPGMAEWISPSGDPEIKAFIEAFQPPPVPPQSHPQPTSPDAVQQPSTPAGLLTSIPPAPQPFAAESFREEIEMEPVYEGLDIQVNETSYTKCHTGKRLGAYVIDSLISGVFLIPSVIIFITAFNESRLLVPLLMLSVMLVFPSLIYTFIRDGLGQGQSWGKQLLGLMVVDLKTNEPCSKGKSFVRNLIWFLISLFPYVGWLVEPIIVLADDRGRRLGDRAAGTMVINIEAYTGERKNLLRA